jgi:contact-dependent growth inhibition (CDI) system CdiI-like immunity protein
MFEIRLLPPSQVGPDGQRLGMITIGDFTEIFAVWDTKKRVSQMESCWRDELYKLLGGTVAVALIHDPRLAWIIYREGEHCFVQQRLAVDGEFYPIAPRRRYTPDGKRISEWATTVRDIERFLNVTAD